MTVCPPPALFHQKKQVANLGFGVINGKDWIVVVWRDEWRKKDGQREETTRRAINIPVDSIQGFGTDATTWPTTLNCFVLFSVVSLRRQEEELLPCLTFSLLFYFGFVRLEMEKQKRWASKTIRQKKKPGPINIPGLLFPTRRRRLIPQHPRQQLTNNMLVPPLPKRRWKSEPAPFWFPFLCISFVDVTQRVTLQHKGGCSQCDSWGPHFIFWFVTTVKRPKEEENKKGSTPK